MSIVDRLTDWNAVRIEKRDLLNRLRMVPPGKGLSIKDPGTPIRARAIIELLREHPYDFEGLDFGFEVTIMRKESMARVTDAGNLAHLHQNYGVLDADGIAKLELHKGHRLPAHSFRDGVPDDINGPINTDANTIITGDK